MHDLLALGARAGALLKQRGETISVGETSSGGLIAASLLAIPGASEYFVGGAITYSREAIKALAGISLEQMRASAIRSSGYSAATRWVIAPACSQRVRSSIPLRRASADNS